MARFDRCSERAPTVAHSATAAEAFEAHFLLEAIGSAAEVAAVVGSGFEGEVDCRPSHHRPRYCFCLVVDDLSGSDCCDSY